MWVFNYLLNKQGKGIYKPKDIKGIILNPYCFEFLKEGILEEDDLLEVEKSCVPEFLDCGIIKRRFEEAF